MCLARPKYLFLHADVLRMDMRHTSSLQYCCKHGGRGIHELHQTALIRIIPRLPRQRLPIFERRRRDGVKAHSAAASAAALVSCRPSAANVG